MCLELQYISTAKNISIKEGAGLNMSWVVESLKVFASGNNSGVRKAFQTV